jgi:hypothetical protein
MYTVERKLMMMMTFEYREGDKVTITTQVRGYLLSPREKV